MKTVKVAGNTWRITHPDGKVEIKFYDTIIVTTYPDGRVMLNSGGFITNTTKARMNQFSSVNVSSKKGQWFVNDTIPYEDHMVIGDGAAKQEGGIMRSAGIIAKLGDIFCETPEAKNDWKKRMLKAGAGDGLSFPDDWDQLSEQEKERRLNGAIGIVLE